MEYVVLITTLILLHYIYLMSAVGSARGRNNIQAPAVTGSEDFERHLRVQVNTLEQMAIALPAMWMCAYTFSAQVAAALGLIYLAGRVVYALAYVKDPSTRGKGMMIGFLAYIAMLGCALYGAFFGAMG